jgi:hypothetical protein
LVHSIQVKLTKAEVAMLKVLLTHTVKELERIDSKFAGPEGQHLMSALDAAAGGGGGGGATRALSAAPYAKDEAEDAAELPQLQAVSLATVYLFFSF